MRGAELEAHVVQNKLPDILTYLHLSFLWLSIVTIKVSYHIIIIINFNLLNI